jgi:hypothetical protein
MAKGAMSAAKRSLMSPANRFVAERMPYVIFRVGDNASAACQIMDCVAFYKDASNAVVAHFVACENAECNCHAYRIDDVGIARLQAHGVNVRRRLDV